MTKDDHEKYWKELGMSKGFIMGLVNLKGVYVRRQGA